jgi:hypothetical protein
MRIPVRRPVKLSSRIRRNFARRDGTSIGLRGVRVPLRKPGTPRTATFAGSNPSDTRMDESRIVGFDAPESNPPLTCRTPSEKDWSEWLWLGLILLAIAAAATVQLMQ